MRIRLLAGALLITAACGGGIRPGYTPFPEARVDTLSAAPAGVVQAIISAIATEGLQIQWQSEAEGFVETQWYDIISRRSGSFDRAQPERYMLLRFYVDPLGTDRSVISSEAIIKRTVDPSVLARDSEMMVPAGHGGDAILDRVLSQVRRSAR